MFSRTDARFGCTEYQASLEDTLRDGEARVEPDSALQRHPLSVYLREFAPVRGTLAVNATAEIGAGMPEPPAQPADADEVLMSLADTGETI